jgi:very-short-patch-repair endonuclease
MRKAKPKWVKPSPALLASICDRFDIPVPVCELRFHPTRKWKFDYAWTYLKVVLELEGGAYAGHGHRSVGKFLADMEKYNTAAMMGWKVLRCTTTQMESGEAFEMVHKALYKLPV